MSHAYILTIDAYPRHTRGPHRYHGNDWNIASPRRYTVECHCAMFLRHIRGECRRARKDTETNSKVACVIDKSSKKIIEKRFQKPLSLKAAQ